MVVMLRGFISI
ncbi:hypothetical protein LINPERHAP1_LOCUS11323 [Linum perenne]